MEQYISKSALVAEIEKKRKQYANERNTITKNNENCHVLLGRIKMCDNILSFLDTIEVKEVALKENHELTWEDVAWIVNKTILQCRVESTLTAEDICKDVLRQFKAQKGK